MMFKVPRTTAESELVIKKSRFIGWAGPAASRDEALQLVARAKQRYPDARHHCWAYLIGNAESASNAAMNDDGEPCGTAGKPILNVIQHKGIGNVAVVAIRYFGGVKLGAGGLVRAYAGITEQVLSELSLKDQIAMSTYSIQADFSQEQFIRHWLSQYNGELVDVRYNQRVVMKVRMENTSRPDFEGLCDASGIPFKLLTGRDQ